MRKFVFALAMVVGALFPAMADAAPKARFTISPSTPRQGQLVTFHARSSRCDRGPCTYRWYQTKEFARSSRQPRRTATRRYTGSPGRRSVKLVVRNARGQSSSVTHRFTVRKRRHPSPTPQPPSQPPAPSPSPPPPSSSPSEFPNASSTGVPAGWAPAQTTNGNLTVTQNGAVIENRLVTGSILVRAQNVTVRNSWVYGQIYNQVSGQAYNGMLIEDTTIGPPTGVGSQTSGGIGVAGYTARRVKIINSKEGFRVGGYNNSGGKLGGVTIEDSFVRLAGTGDCPHSDGVQGYDEPPRTVIRHNTIDLSGLGCTTGAIYVGNDNPDLITIQNNLLAGGSYTMRLQEGAGTYDHVSGNRFVNGEWDYGPTYVVKCSAIADWSDNALVRIDASYHVTSVVRSLTTC
jgi:hypothetical protein